MLPKHQGTQVSQKDCLSDVERRRIDYVYLVVTDKDTLILVSFRRPKQEYRSFNVTTLILGLESCGSGCIKDESYWWGDLKVFLLRHT